MKADLNRIDIKLPIPVMAEAHIYPISKPPRLTSGYDASGVIDTVEIRHGDFQTLPAAKQARYIPASRTGKGVYIDLWA